jgi:hypothetical protein
MTSHLWILRNLIFLKDPESSFSTLLKYTITTCYSKMNRRFKHHLSQRHLESLEHLKVEDFSFNPELQSDTDPGKMSNDRALITGFVFQTKENPNMLTSSIPNIQLLCDNLPHKSEPFQLYTSETCREFHSLVVELLGKFRNYLNDLEGRLKGDPAAFKDTVNRTIVFGNALLRIARGSAFEMHLQNIATLLEDHRRISDAEISMPMPDLAMEDEEADVENEEEELDEELLPIMSFVTDEGQPMPLWKIYRDWMRLMIVHFDAAKILTGYASQSPLPYKTVSFKILVYPRVDQAFLPWSDLFSDSRFIPQAQAIADATGRPGIHKSNEEILKFLNDGLKSVKTSNAIEKQGRSVMKIWKNSSKYAGYEQTVQKLTALKPAYKDDSDIDEILALLSTWKKNQLINSQATDEITGKLHSWYGKVKSTAEKNSVSFPIDSGNCRDFSGTLHCEAGLASILHKGTRDSMRADEYQDLLKETDVNYNFSDLSMS